jgi:hypothetical protein
MAGDLLLLNLPAVGYNFDDGVPIGWMSATLNGTGGEFKFHPLAQSAPQQALKITWRS